MKYRESASATINFLFPGYSLHHKPFTMNEKNGLPHSLLRLQTEGDCFAWLNGAYTTVLPGDLLLYKEGDPYELIIGYPTPAANEPLPKIQSADYHLLIRGSWFDEWWQDNSRPSKINIGLDERVLSIWRQLVQEKRRIHDQVDDILLHLTKALCLMLDRSIKEHHMLPAKSRLLSTAYQMKYFVEQHAIESFTLQQVADHVQLSVSRAAHVFKEAFGQTIMDYAIKIRLSMACERIVNSAMKLEQIAELCGFQSYTYFHRTFRSRLGVSPQQYREQKRLFEPTSPLQNRQEAAISPS